MRVRWTEILGYQHSDPYMGFQKTGETPHEGTVVGYVAQGDHSVQAVIVEGSSLVAVSIDDLEVDEARAYGRRNPA